MEEKRIELFKKLKRYARDFEYMCHGGEGDDEFPELAEHDVESGVIAVLWTSSINGHQLCLYPDTPEGTQSLQSDIEEVESVGN